MNEEYLLLERDSAILEVAIKAVLMMDHSSFDSSLARGDGRESKQALIDSMKASSFDISKKQRELNRRQDP